MQGVSAAMWATGERTRAGATRTRLEQAGEVGMQEVDDQAFDVGPVVVLIRHDHQLPVAQRLGVRVRLAVLQSQDLLDVADLCVRHDLRGRRADCGGKPWPGQM